MAAWWHENFMEWAAGTQIDTIPGTGWSKANIGAACTVENNANFNSGKCLQVDGGDEITLYTGVGPSGLNVVSWNWIKTLNMASQKSGIRFLTAGNVSFRVFWSTNIGQVDTIILEWTNSAGTVAQLYASVRQYLSGVKYPCAVQWNDVTGEFTLNLNGEIFSTTQAQFAGNPITSLAFGKMQTAGGSGQSLVGDLYGYSGVAYVGPVEIRGGFPNANRPLQDWAAVGAANAWDCINNTFTAAPTQYIEGSSAGQVSQFTAPVSVTNVFQVYSGEHQYYAIRTDVSAVDMNGQIGDIASTVDGATTAPLPTAYQRFHDIYGAINPNTGVAWALADLTGLVLGYERQT